MSSPPPMARVVEMPAALLLGTYQRDAATADAAGDAGAASAASPQAASSGDGAAAAVSPRAARYVFFSEVALGVTYALIGCLSAIVVWQLAARQSERHVVAWCVGAICVAIALPLSLHDIHMHVSHYVSPLQRLYMRILCMVPIYAVESWLALRFKDQKIFLETARECYEAYVIYSFFKLLSEFLGPRERTLQLLGAKAQRTGRATAHMLFPFCCLRPWRLDAEFLWRCQFCTFQYVFVRLALSIAVFAASYEGDYDEGNFEDFSGLYVYSVVLLNFSQLWAMWALVMMYHELVDELKPLGPFPKFIAIKHVKQDLMRTRPRTHEASSTTSHPGLKPTIRTP